VRQGGTALANRVIVAAGGGGNADNFGGNGGGTIGTGGGASGAANGGAGGTQTAGGAGGSGSGNAGSPGSLGAGGAGGVRSFGNGGAGGGGGYYGGGGGGTASFGSGAGGGGGSSYIPPTDPSAYTVSGANADFAAGKIVVSYVAAANYSSVVDSAQINSGGTLGGWQDANGGGASFTNARAYPNAIIYGNYLYVVGGYNGTNYYSDVQYALLNGDGTLGSWSYTTSFNLPRISQTVVAANGYMYILGGNNGSTYYNDVQFASILTSGQLGAWQTSPNTFATARTNASAALYNGYIYILGGNDGTATRRSDTQYAPLNSLAPMARYSVLLSTDKPTNPVNYYLTTTSESPGSTVTAGYTTATTGSPTLGSLTTVTNPTSGSKYPITISGDGVSYYWLYLTIDDSQSMTFGPEAPSNISFLQLNYHANPSMRLRGGQTFNGNATNNTLDAP
jgi:hypothetical protein